MSISETIRNRIIESGKTFFANENISEFINDNELDELQDELATKMQEVLRTLIIDTDNDHNTKETAQRVAKMYLKEVFKGRYVPRPKITDFPNAKDLDEIYTLGPISLRSACSHHFVEIEGNVWIGIIPSDRVIGISKFARLLDWIATRPHIQEEMSIMLADELERLIKPKGIAIVIKAKHHCMTWRGVKEKDVSMVSSVVRGEFRDSPHLKKEFFDIIQGQGYSSN
jgi:GTP cyclohydrolase I